MKRSLVATLLLLLTMAPQMAAAEPGFTSPIHYTWIANGCRTWECAQTAMMSANGDGSVLAMPTGNAAHPWVVLRRVESGSVFVPSEEKFMCENFTATAVALARYDGIPRAQNPLMVTVQGGATLVVFMRNDRTRATRH